jgi:non-heme Fe2+,alpha-ketoglutarate-dependent halogenase
LRPLPIQHAAPTGSPKALSAQQIAAYRARGYHAPLQVLSTAEAAAYRRNVEAFEAAMGPLSNPSNPFRHKAYLLFPWLDELIRRPALLDAVEDVLQSPDLLVWTSQFFVKEANDPSFVSYHQDSTYLGLNDTNIVTAWIAFADSTIENGALRVVPGSHLREQLAHRENILPGNMLTRRQEIAVDVLEHEPVPLELRAGEASLHHVRMVHGSEPNRSEDRRIGLAVRYVPTRIKPIHKYPDHATLVRGEDRYGHFTLETPPKSAVDPASILLMEQYRRVLEASHAINSRNLDEDRAD